MILLIGWLVFSSHVKQHSELERSKMDLIANDFAHKIIQAQMQKLDLSQNDFKITQELKFGLYDDLGNEKITQIEEIIDFSKKFYERDGSLYVINKSVAGHMGISYVVIEKPSFHNQIAIMIQNTIAIMVGVYIMITVIGFYLAKLFIYPIQAQREKLNNFIKDTTHEINTPLAALLLSVESDNFFTEKNRDYIRLSAKKISNLYKDLTYVFLKKNIKKELEFTNLSEILKKELDYYTKLATKKKITINHQIENMHYKIEEEDFIRLTNNIISNAIKYTKRNGEITISFYQGILIVQDTGIGITEEKLNKIFERYYRATNEVGGFGIGLDIVKTICSNYNIKVEVDSKLNEGTTFKLYFKNPYF